MTLLDQGRQVLQVRVAGMEKLFGRRPPKKAAPGEHQILSDDAMTKAFDIMYEIAIKYALDRLCTEELSAAWSPQKDNADDVRSGSSTGSKGKAAERPPACPYPCG